MDEREDIDRAAILARRRRFIGMALAGISGLATGSVLTDFRLSFATRS